MDFVKSNSCPTVHATTGNVTNVNMVSANNMEKKHEK
jgi:hypothetical protein